MNRSFAVLALVFAVSMLIGIQTVEVADANPFSPPVYRQIDPIPGTIPPEIKVTSPRNNTNYTDNVTVTLNVVKPQLSKWDSSITEIVYTLDQSNFKPLYNIRYEKTASGIPGISEYKTTFSLPYYSGNHTITIRVIGAVVDSPTRTMFYVDSSSTVSFTMNNQTPSPTPSQSIPTINTGPTLPVELTPSIVYIILAIVIAIVAVSSISLVYFRRRKGKP
jgi:hypothetical protein